MYFYSRPCGRGDDFGVCLSFGSDVFLLTPLREGRPNAAAAAEAWRSISTHAPAGGATRTLGLHGAPPEYFYSRPCGRGDSKAVLTIAVISPFLLTPLREGRLQECHERDEAGHISTHAPAGGATGVEQLRTERILISTHAPAGGATGGLGGLVNGAINFYSRPCGRGDFVGWNAAAPVTSFLLTPLREGRQRRACRTGTRNSISTHAPAGGATATSRGCPLFLMVFLLTPLREGRRKLRYSPVVFRAISTHAPAGGATVFACVFVPAIKFLLTPLREGRPEIALADLLAHLNFYSRPCGRGDRPGRIHHRAVRSFLLTPLREGRPSAGTYPTSGFTISTHAPAGGATGTRENGFSLFGISTHAPAGGATRRVAVEYRQWGHFYSRPCGRGDCCDGRH